MTTTPALLGPLTRDEVHAIVRANCSHEDLRRFRASPDGEAMLSALLDPLCALSTTLERAVCAQHLVARMSDLAAPAAGASKATVTVRLTRAPAAGTGQNMGQALTLPARRWQTFAVASVDGHLFVPTTEVSWAAGELGAKSVQLEAVVAGTAPNVFAGRLDRFRSIATGFAGDDAQVVDTTDGWSVYYAVPARTEWPGLPQDIFPSWLAGAWIELTSGDKAGARGEIVEVLSGAPSGTPTTASWRVLEWAELGLSVVQEVDCTPGTDDELDRIGTSRGRLRQAGETDAAYRSALLYLDDRISPRAISRAMQRAIQTAGGSTAALLHEPTCAEGDLQGQEASWRGLDGGTVVSATPIGVPFGDDLEPAPDGAPPVPPAGPTYLDRGRRHIIVSWAGEGLEDTGGFLRYHSGGIQPDPMPDDTTEIGLPRAAVADVTPLGGRAFGDDSIRASILATVRATAMPGVSMRLVR